MINIFHTVLGMVGTNCYIIINDECKECIVVDPADNSEGIYNVINQENCKLKAILLTHGHFDHMLAADDLRNRSGAIIYAGYEEEDVLNSSSYNLSGVMGGCATTLKADEFLKDNEEFQIAGIRFMAFHTPGHTKGSMCYYIKDIGTLLSGDTLFEASVGRTDFPTGSMSQIIKSIKDKLFVLPDDTKVLPGHGDETTIGYEKKYNPYCQ